MLQILRDQFLFQSGTLSVANSIKEFSDVLLQKLEISHFSCEIVKGWHITKIPIKLEFLYGKVGNTDLVLRSYQEKEATPKMK